MKKNKILVLVLGILLAAALAVGLYFGVKALTGSGSEASDTAAPTVYTDPSESGSADPTGEAPTLSPEMSQATAKENYTEENLAGEDTRLDLNVAECAGQSLSNRQAQIYYFMQFYSFMNQYGSMASMFGLDATQPLSGQSSIQPGLNWEQYFLFSGMQQFQQFAAAAAKAESEGYTMSAEEQEEMESALAGMEEDAKSYGFDSVDAYLQDSFGPGVRFQDYEAYLRLYFPAMSYENKLYQSITWTDEDLREYFDNHPEEFSGLSTDTPNVNVRHILFLSDGDQDGTVTDEEKSAAQARAEELLAGFRSNPSEDYFAELAGENSEDPGSKDNGGLYEDVYPGQMVESFNDWCFDPARQPGDTDIVETSYGFHVMYFVKTTDNYYWKTQAEERYPNAMMESYISEIVAAYPLTVRYEDVILAPIPQPETE